MEEYDSDADDGQTLVSSFSYSVKALKPIGYMQRNEQARVLCSLSSTYSFKYSFTCSQKPRLSSEMLRRVRLIVRDSARLTCPQGFPTQIDLSVVLTSLMLNMGARVWQVI